MAERIAAAEIYVGVRDDEALANLRRIQAQFDRTMDDIDRTEAEATVGANLAPLKDDLANAKRMLRQLEAEEAELGVEISDADKARFKKDIAEAKRLIKVLDGEVATVEIEVHGEKEALAAQERIRKATQDRFDAEEKLLNDLEKTREAAARRETARVNREARVRESLNRQRVRELATAEREAYARQRELQSIPKLEQAYVGLQRRLEQIGRARSRARGDKEALFYIDVEERTILADIERMRAEIQAIAGRDPIEIPVRAKMARHWGEMLRGDIIQHQGNWMAVSGAIGVRMGNRMRDGWRDGLNRGLSRVGIDAAKAVGGAVASNLAMFGSRITHAAAGLADSTIRLGPFTTTIRKAVIGLSLFAPILLDVVGALGALTGSIGSATLGLGALGTAVVGGGIPVMLGMGIVIKQVASEFSNVMKAQKAYDDALRKGNTELAATKMKELKAVMGNVSKETVRNIGLARKLNDRWKEATEPARAAAFTTIGKAIRMASDLMPEFAARTNTAMQTAGRSINQWMDRLSSAGGRSALFEMMDNFNIALGPVLDGLGDIAAYLGRVGQIASRFLPGMANDFATWAHNLNSVDTTALEGKVGRVISSLKALGRFLMAGGRLLKAFFGAGVESGDHFLDTMTKAMNGWTEWMNTAEGQTSLKSFFAESVEGARTLWNTLQPLVTSFVRWAANVAPFARAFFDGAAAVGNLVAEFLRLTGLSGPLSALVTTLGALWAWGKIRTAAAAMQGFIGGLTGVAAAENTVAASAGRATVALNAQTVAAERAALAGRAAAVSGAAGTAMSAGGVLLPGRAAAAAGGVAAAASASKWARLGTAVNGASLAMLGMKAATAGWIGAGALAVYGLYKLSKGASETEAALEEVNKAAEASDKSFADLATVSATTDDLALALESSGLGIKQLRQSLNGLTKGSLEYKIVMNQIKQQEKARAAQAQELINQMNEENRLRTNGVESARLENRNARDNVKLMKERLDRAKELVKQGYGGDTRGAMEDYNNALKRQNQAHRHLRDAQALATLSTLNQGRAMAKLEPIAQNAARAFRTLEKAGGKQLATKISLKYDDPGKAARVGQAAARALKQGAGRGTVMKIVADSRSAEEAIRRLNRARISPKELRIIAKGGDDALRELQKIVGVKLAPKVQRIIGSDEDARSKIKKLIGLGIPPKVAKMLGDNDDALDKARQANNTVLKTLSQVIRRTISNPSNLFSNLAGITQPIYRKIVNRADGGMFAGGGNTAQALQSGALPDERKQQRAARTAELSGVGQAISQKVNRPRFLVGEEATPEFVVSTNPKYRQRNQKYAAMAARAVGLDVIDAADGFGGFGPGAGFHPDAVLKRKMKFKRAKGKHKKSKVYKTRRRWATYVANLEKQQGYWEREVGIRESKVREPEDMVVRDPERDKTVEDPVTKEKVKVEAYKPNPLIESQYKPDLQKVINAMNTLMSIVRELVRAIPHALAAARQERGFRHDRIVDLNAEIKKEKGKLRDAGKDDKQKHQNRIDKLTNERDRHQTIRDTLAEDIKELKASQVEAGFDWREFAISRKALRKERDEAFDKATTQATEDTLANFPQPGTGGDGGGGDGGAGAGAGGITYGQQAALADTEKANVLRDFGSNFISAITGTPGGLGGAGAGAGQGMQSNIAALTGVGGTTADLTAATSGSAAARTVQSAGTASATISGGGTGGTVVQGGSTQVEGDKTIIVQAEFAEVPPDPHTFVKGVEFEVASVI